MATVKLTASGKTGSGKTLILELCREFLISKGYWVSEIEENRNRTQSMTSMTIKK